MVLLEGKSAALTANAGGAQKVRWILKADDKATVVAVDRFSFVLNAGRVTGDQSRTLQFQAVYGDAVKTIDIPVTIQEDIPDPVFTPAGTGAVGWSRDDRGGAADLQFTGDAGEKCRRSHV